MKIDIEQYQDVHLRDVWWHHGCCALLWIEQSRF